jgi:superfamily II DNA or RNA helicase
VSSDILTRGFDQTDVKHVVIAKPLRKAFSMHVQMVGRGARPHNGKDFCVIQDNAGNWLRFLEDWDQIYEEGTKKLDEGQDSKTRKEKSEEEKKQSKCPVCSHVWPSGSDTCLNCGHVKEKRSMVASLPGEMEELAQAVSKDSKQDFWSMCQYKIKYSGWSESRALAAYKSKFGVWPKGVHKTPMPPDMKFERDAKAGMIRYLKGKGKSK